MRVVLSEAHLEAPVSLERGLAMSTLISSEEWHLECDWDGRTIGDVFLYRDKTLKGEKGPYFGNVPAAKVKCYRFLNGEPDGKREAGPTKAGTAKAAGQPTAA